VLLTSCPDRNNSYPYLGSKIIDGTTTRHDWLGIAPITHLPFIINPSKGFFTTANNRVVPDNSKYHFGAPLIATGRSHRLTEIIE